MNVETLQTLHLAMTTSEKLFGRDLFLTQKYNLPQAPTGILYFMSHFEILNRETVFLFLRIS